jgi:hypothetical protein
MSKRRNLFFEIVIDGKTVKMEERKCLGCKATFKVKKGSPQLYHNFDCEAEHKGIKPVYDFYFGVEVAPQVPKHGSIEVDDED